MQSLCDDESFGETAIAFVFRLWKYDFANKFGLSIW